MKHKEKLPINTQAIIDEVGNILNYGKEIFSEIFDNLPENFRHIYVDKILIPILNSEQSMDLKLMTAYFNGKAEIDLDIHSMTADLGLEESENTIAIKHIILMLAIAIDATRCTDEIKAWKKLLQANYVMGVIYSSKMTWKARGTHFAKKGAKARHADDPRKKEKKLIKDCWLDWQIEKTTKYKSKAAFARDMLDKVEHLTSGRVIEDWCRQWEKEYKLIQSV